MVLVSIVVAIAMAVVGEILRPKPKFNNPEPSALGDFSFPTVDPSRVVPVFWGTCKISGPNCTWFGDLEVVTLKKKVKTGWFSSQRIKIGFNYYLGVQLVYGYGECDEFIELRADDKALNVSTKVFTGDVCAFTINSPTILSTDDPPSGVKGNAKLYKGTFTQPANAYLAAQWEEPDTSAFRPLIHLVLEKCYLGNTETPPPITLIARRCPNQLGLTGGTHNVNGDSNIACAAYELMTDMLWGMKVPASKIDLDSFRACGQTFFSEGLGISMSVQNPTSGRELLAEILRHGDAVVYADPVTGLYTMALARDDYLEYLDELLVLDNSNIVPDSFEFTRTSWDITKNTIIVNYTERTSFQVEPVQYQDLANIDTRKGVIDPEEINFLGFSNAQAALNAAARACKVKSSPLMSAQFSTNRIGYQLRPGSVFILNRPQDKIEQVVMRVIEISYGTLDDMTIKIKAMEDVFSVGYIAYNVSPPSDWVNPVGTLAPLAHQRLIEAPAFGATDTTRRFAITLGVSGAAGTTGYDVWTDPAGGSNYEQSNEVTVLTPSGVLVGAYPASGAEVDAVGFTVSSVSDADNIDAGSAGSREAGENFAVIGNEWLAWQTKTVNGDGTITFSGVFRGVLDTMAADHAAGARVYFLSEGAGVTDEEGYADNSTVSAKLLPKNVTSTMLLSEVTAISTTTNSRALRPLPPGKFRVNGLRPGAAVAGEFTVSWAHRNRLSPLVASQSDDSLQPEEGTTYNIRVYNNSTNALLASSLGVDSSATSAVVRISSTATLRVELESVRDGLTSWTKQVGIFSYTPAGVLVNQIVADEASYILDGGGA